MDEIPSVIPKAILEVISRLENDEDNRYTWKLTRNLDSLSFTVNCKFRAKKLATKPRTTARSPAVLL